MLDVDGGDHVDAGGDDLFDVLVALGVVRAGHVGMRELVDDHHVGLARDDRVDVHLFEFYIAVIDLAARNDLEVADPLLGLAAMMRLDETEHDIHSPIAELMRLLEHPVCLAYARGGADIDFEPSALSLGHQVEKSFGLESFVIAHSSPGVAAMTSRGASAVSSRRAIEGQVQ